MTSIHPVCNERLWSGVRLHYGAVVLNRNTTDNRLRKSTHQPRHSTEVDKLSTQVEVRCDKLSKVFTEVDAWCDKLSTEVDVRCDKLCKVSTEVDARCDKLSTEVDDQCDKLSKVSTEVDAWFDKLSTQVEVRCDKLSTVSTEGTFGVINYPRSPQRWTLSVTNCPRSSQRETFGVINCPQRWTFGVTNCPRSQVLRQSTHQPRLSASDTRHDVPVLLRRYHSGLSVSLCVCLSVCLSVCPTVCSTSLTEMIKTSRDKSIDDQLNLLNIPVSKQHFGVPNFRSVSK